MQNEKRFLTALILSTVFLFMQMSMAESFLDKGYTYGDEQSKLVSLKEKPDMLSKTLGEYYNGVYFAEQKRFGEWSYVKLFSWNDYDSFGYVLTSNLVTDRETSGYTVPLGNAVKSNNEMMYLYTAPHEDARIIGQCIDGTPIGIQGVYDGWFHVIVGDACQGYLKSEHVNASSHGQYEDILYGDKWPIVQTLLPKEKMDTEDGFISLHILPDESTDKQIDLGEGIDVLLIKDLGEWAEIKIYSFCGFVKSEYLTLPLDDM